TATAVVPVHASSLTVNAADNIYAAGQASTNNVGGGNLPGSIALQSGTTWVQFTAVTGSYTSPSANCGSVAGCITVNGGGNFNDADGVGAAPSSSTNTGASSLSGIDAPNAGEL